MTGKKNRLAGLVEEKAGKHRIAVAPLMGFPGVRLRGATVKIAQQNCRKHFRAIEKLYDLFAPDMVFPLMDLSAEANALDFYTVFPVDDTPTVVKPDFTSEIIDRIRQSTFHLMPG